MPRIAPVLLAVAWLASGFGSPVARAEAIERAWPHSGNGSVTVDNARGSVEVIGWAEPRVRLRGELAEGAELVVQGASSTRLQLAVTLDVPLGARGTGSRLTLHVPHGVALTVTGVSADVMVRDMRNASMVAISTVSGNQKFAGTARAARLKSVSGDLDVSGAASRNALATVSGDVELQGFVGGAEVSVVSGDVRIRNSSLGVLDLDSVSGDIEIAATPVHDARWKIGSLGGDIDIHGLERARVAVWADTFSGSIESDSPGAADVGANGADRIGRRLRFDPPGADARIVIDSFSGDIRLHRAP